MVVLTSRRAILVDEVGNPLKKVESLGDYDSEDKGALVDNDMTCSMASERVGFGTQSLLEQWRDSYGNGDYDEDPYDDDIMKIAITLLGKMRRNITVVDIMNPAEPPEFTNKRIASEELTDDQKDEFKNLSRKGFEKQRALSER
ncbi:hypothetical protein Tco_0844916 [Tanacetum coccineum]